MQSVNFAECMRTHGVTSFSDPIPGHPDQYPVVPGANPQSPAFRSAAQACSRFNSGASVTSDPAAAEAVKRTMLAKARCMRAHGTLYTALDRLRADGLIDVDREEIVESRLRRYYRLTPTGGEQLAEEAARLRSNAHVAMSRLDLSGGVATT